MFVLSLLVLFYRCLCIGWYESVSVVCENVQTSYLIRPLLYVLRRTCLFPYRLFQMLNLLDYLHYILSWYHNLNLWIGDGSIIFVLYVFEFLISLVDGLIASISDLSASIWINIVAFIDITYILSDEVVGVSSFA